MTTFVQPYVNQKRSVLISETNGVTVPVLRSVRLGKVELWGRSVGPEIHSDTRVRRFRND